MHPSSRLLHHNSMTPTANTLNHTHTDTGIDRPIDRIPAPSMKLLVATFAASALLLLAALPQAAGHARWLCPKPRDEADEQGHHILFDNTGA